MKKKRTAIVPPVEMPKVFEYKQHTYRWYQGLAREKKRRMIQIYHEIKAQIQATKEASTPGPTPGIVPSALELEGVAIWYWDERAGPRILGKYPETFQIDKATMMQMYGNHLAGGGTGIAALEAKNKLFISYFTGPIPQFEAGFYIFLAGPPNQDPDRAEPILTKFCDTIIRRGPIDVESGFPPIRVEALYRLLTGQK
jgi:hypothetical protein